MEKVNEKTPNSVYCTTCFLYQKLAITGYDSVASWIKVNLLTYNKFIIPLNHGRSHWCVLVVDVAKKEFRYYDSLGGANFRCTEIIRYFVKIDMYDTIRTLYIEIT
jgi:Ulp1 family protease